MAVGNPKVRGNAASDPIVRAIAAGESGTTGEIRVHLSKRLWEFNPYRRAQKLFERFEMSKTRHRNAVLLYLNLRRKRFAIVADQGLDQSLGRGYWQELATSLTEDLRATDPERAIAMAVERIAERLHCHFPKESG